MKNILLLIIIVSLSLYSCGIDGMLQEAEIKKSAGKTSDALELYSRAIQQDKNNVEAYEERAEIYEALGQRDDAISDYIKAAENASLKGDKEKSASLFYQVGLLYDIRFLELGDLKACEYSKPYYSKACDLGDKSACNVPCVTQLIQ